MAMYSEYKTKFRPVPGYEGIYEVNEAGIVRSLPRSVPTRNNQFTRVVPGRVLTPWWDPARQDHRVNLSKDGKTNHRLVMSIVFATWSDKWSKEDIAAWKARGVTEPITVTEIPPGRDPLGDRLRAVYQTKEEPDHAA